MESRWEKLHADRFGQPVGVLETNTDVTAREAAHAALVRSERRYRRMFEGSRVGVVEEDWTAVRAVLGDLRDAAGLAEAIAADPGLVARARRAARIVGVNPAFRAMLGLETGALTVDDLFGDDTSFVGVLAAFVGGARSLEGDVEVARADGTRMPVMFGIHFEDGAGDAGSSSRRRPLGAAGGAGRAAGRADRCSPMRRGWRPWARSRPRSPMRNQPLMAVVTNGEAALRWLRRPEPDLGEVEAGLSVIVAEGRRASGIVAGIRGFARARAAPAREALALDEPGGGGVAPRRPRDRPRPGPWVAVSAEPGLPRVTVDRVFDPAGAGQPRAQRRAGARRGRGPRRIRVAAARDGAGVVVTVADNGPGLGGVDPDRLFAPFFTTKPTGPAWASPSRAAPRRPRRAAGAPGPRPRGRALPPALPAAPEEGAA